MASREGRGVLGEGDWEGGGRTGPWESLPGRSAAWTHGFVRAWSRSAAPLPPEKPWPLHGVSLSHTSSVPPSWVSLVGPAFDMSFHSSSNWTPSTPTRPVGSVETSTVSLASTSSSPTVSPGALPPSAPCRAVLPVPSHVSNCMHMHPRAHVPAPEHGNLHTAMKTRTGRGAPAHTHMIRHAHVHMCAHLCDLACTPARPHGPGTHTCTPTRSRHTVWFAVTRGALRGCSGQWTPLYPTLLPEITDQPPVRHRPCSWSSFCHQAVAFCETHAQAQEAPQCGRGGGQSRDM